jgi:hypothetical protein
MSEVDVVVDRGVDAEVDAVTRPSLPLPTDNRADRAPPVDNSPDPSDLKKGAAVADPD